MKLSTLHASSVIYFLEVAKLGSISAASETLHVAVSAISRQISRLESDLGTDLFLRNTRGMALTEAGQVVQQYARRLLLDTETLQAELLGLQGLKHSTVRIVCTDGFAQDYLPSVIVAFRKLYPGVMFSLDVCAPALATKMVREGIADVALTFTIAAQEGIYVEYAEAAPIYAHVDRRHPLTLLGQVSLRDIVAYPVVLPTGPNIVRQLFDLVCGLGNLQPTVLLTSNSLAGLTGFLRYGSAVNFCGSLSVRNSLRANQQVLIPITDPEMNQRVLQVQTMAGRQLSPAVRAFIDVLIDDIKKRRRGVLKSPGTRASSSIRV
jgi:DNA-binding transcriptional LysR family regulator